MSTIPYRVVDREDDSHPRLQVSVVELLLVGGGVKDGQEGGVFAARDGVDAAPDLNREEAYHVTLD